MHLYVLYNPVRIMNRSGFVHLSNTAKIICHLQNHIRELKLLFPLIRKSINPQPCTQDISCHRTCGITVPAVIHGSNHACGKIIWMPQGAVERNSQCLLGNPSITQQVNILKIVIRIIFRQSDGPVDDLNQLSEMASPSKISAAVSRASSTMSFRDIFFPSGGYTMRLIT